MVFSSVLFLFFFLPLALAFYFASPRSWRFVTLTLCSYAFYAWSDPRFVALLLWVTIVDFTIGNLLGRRQDFSPRARRVLLALSLTNSLGLLAWFKYAVFAHGLMSQSIALFGGTAWPAWQIVLPAGISFYTFESISYVVDIYRRETRPAGEAHARAVPVARRTPARRAVAQARAFVAFACYLAQFPHLVAGPIVRFQELGPQLHRPRIDLDAFTRGWMLLSFGLAKKVLIANTLAVAVDAGFGEPSMPCLDTWMLVIGFSFQLYFDFSGYTDMACGLGLMLGFEFPRNFNAPYRATSIADFWRRWHMTLSRWLRDYLYIPLGGNRRGRLRTALNLLATMILGGLWHGASINFAIWGLWHGALLAIERAFLGRRGPSRPAGRVRSAVAGVMTFGLVSVGWVPFRAIDLSQATVFFFQLFIPVAMRSRGSASEVLHGARMLIALAAAAALAFGGMQAWDVCRRVTPVRMTAAIALLTISVCVLCVQASNPFLYFRF